MPVQAVFLFGFGDRGIANQRLQGIDIDGRTLLSFGDQLGEQRFQLRDVVTDQVGALRIRVIQLKLLHHDLARCWGRLSVLLRKPTIFLIVCF